jgi:hypothetical protein
MSNAPEREFVLAIKIGADSLPELLDTLKRKVDELDEYQGGHYSSVVGGAGIGGIVVLEHNDGQTHDRYFEELDDWLEAHQRDGATS